MQNANFLVLNAVMQQNAWAGAFQNDRCRNTNLREEDRAFSMPDDLFRQNFRVTKEGFDVVWNIIGPHIEGGTRKGSISPKMKMLIALRFFAQGSYQMSVANDKNMACGRSTVSKVLSEIISVMNDYLCPECIRLPQSTQELNTISNRIEQRDGMPGVVGYIDGTLIEICPQAIPKAIEFQYVSRKQKHSLNVQIIADDMYRIRGVSARHQGRSHDAAIWAVSSARQFLSQKCVGRNWWLLGDSGYPLEPWLLTPYQNTHSDEEEMFNICHKSMRSLVEKVIGVFKGRWRCLKNERSLHYAPAKCAKIINACAALHNVCIETDFDDYYNGYEFDEDSDDNDEDDGSHHFPPDSLLRDIGNENREYCAQRLLQYE